MMTREQFLTLMSKAYEWVEKGGGDHSVTIRLGKPGQPYALEVWAYSFGIGRGRFVEKNADFDTFNEHVYQEMEQELRELSKKLKAGVLV